MVNERDNNGWEEWRNHVLIELEKNSSQHEKIFEAIKETRTEIATLKVKSGVWGAVAGLIPVGIGLLIFLFRGG